MPELREVLRDAFQLGADVSFAVLMLRLAAALAMGCVVAGVYRLTRRRLSADAQSMVPTLVLLTVLIAMVTLVIGDNIARAFGLVGALSIVRFRTVVEDTRDTAFVIFAVTVGMAIGAGFAAVTVVGIPFAATAAFLFRPRSADEAASDYVLTVRVGIGHDAQTILLSIFDEHFTSVRLQETSTARQGAALELRYRVRLRDANGALPLVAELNAVEAVQGVELKALNGRG